MKNLRNLLALLLIFALTLSSCAAAQADGFSDVPADADYANAVAWCLEQGLMNGIGEATFSPGATLTRAMVATVLYRAAGEPAVSGTPALTTPRPGHGTPAPWSGPIKRVSSRATATASLAPRIR